MRATVDDVERGAGEDVRLLNTGERGNVGVEREALVGGTGLSDSHGDTEDGVGAELALVGGAVKLDEEVIDLLLRGDGELGLDEGGADDLVDVLDGLGHALANVVLAAVTELNGLVGTSRGARGNLGVEEAWREISTGHGLEVRASEHSGLLTLLGVEVNLDGGVAYSAESQVTIKRSAEQSD